MRSISISCLQSTKKWKLLWSLLINMSCERARCQKGLTQYSAVRSFPTQIPQLHCTRHERHRDLGLVLEEFEKRCFWQSRWVSIWTDFALNSACLREPWLFRRQRKCLCRCVSIWTDFALNSACRREPWLFCRQRKCRLLNLFTFLSFLCNK